MGFKEDAQRELQIQSGAASPEPTTSSHYEQTLYDATLGSASWGAAGAASALSKKIGGLTGIDALVAAGATLDEFKQTHPEYAPPKVDNAMELLSSPTALISHVAAGAPQMVATMGLLAIPGYGLPLAAALAYGIDSQESYDSAKAQGATEEEADKYGKISGLTSAALQVIPEAKLLRYGFGGGGLAKAAADRAITAAIAKGATEAEIGPIVRAAIGKQLGREVSALEAKALAAGPQGLKAALRTVGMMSAYGVAQGGAQEVEANATYGAPIQGGWQGFLNRRLVDTITGAANAVAFGVIPHELRSRLGEQTEVPISLDRELHLNSGADYADFLTRQRNVQPELANAAGKLLDSRANLWAEQNNMPAAEFFSKYVQPKDTDEQVAQRMGGDVQKALQAIQHPTAEAVVHEVAGTLVKDLGQETQDALAKAFPKPGEMTSGLLKYLRMGVSPNTELIPAFDQIGGVLRDLYSNVKNTPLAGIKITPEVQGVFDRMFHEDTPEVDVKRRAVGEMVQRLQEQKQVNPIDAINEAVKVHVAAGMEPPKTLDEAQGLVENTLKTLYRGDVAEPSLVHLAALATQGLTNETGTAKGKLNVVFDSRARTLTVEDTGRGLQPQEVLTFFRDLGQPELTSSPAGYGYFKAALFGNSGRWDGKDFRGFEGPPIQLETVSVDPVSGERVQTRAQGDSHQWLSLGPDSGVPGFQTKNLGKEGQTGTSWKIRWSQDPEVEVSRTNFDRLGTALANEFKAKGIKANITMDGQDILANSDVKKRVNLLRDELQRLQQSQLMPRETSEVLRRQRDLNLADLLNSEIPEVTRWRSVLNRMKDSLGATFVDQSIPVRRYPSGKKMVELADNANVYALDQRGNYELENHEVNKNLTVEDRKWLMDKDPDGIYNIQKLVDRVGVPQPIAARSDAVLALQRQLYKINFEMGKEAEKYGVARKTSGGTYEPFKGPTNLPDMSNQRMLRMPTSEARQALMRGDGKLFNAILNAVIKVNPDLQTAIERSDHPDAIRTKLGSALERQFGTTDTRKAGNLEDSRAIKYMPGAVSVDGREVRILELDPDFLLRHTVETQARRIGFIKEFGQGNLDKVGTDKLHQLADILAVHPTFNADVLRERLVAKGVPEDGLDVNFGTLKQIAKLLGEPTGITAKELRDAVNSVGPKDLSPSQVERVQKFAKQVKGVTVETPGLTAEADAPRLLSEIKQRLLESPEDIVDTLKERFKHEGGNVRDFENVYKLAQGIPVYAAPNNPFVKGMQNVSKLLGAAQTSLSAIPNLTLTPTLVPAFAGMKNYLRALDQVFRSPETSRAQVVALGAMRLGPSAWGALKNIRFSETTRVGAGLEYIKEALGIPLEVVQEKNDVIAGLSFKNLADSWRNGEFDSGDAKLAKQLRLNESEIKQIQSGAMSDLTYAKIVQNGVKITQHSTESMHHRALIENHPFLKMMFSYSGYATGMARATGLVMGDAFKALTSGDSALARTTLRHVTYLLGGAMGAGYMSQILRHAVAGKPMYDQDDYWWQKAAYALMDASVLGPTQRVLDAMRYDQGSTDRALVGLMPQLGAVAELVGALYHSGVYGQFPIPEAVGRTALDQISAVRAFRTWYDNLAYPDITDYRESKTATAVFKRRQIRASGKVPPEEGASQINPDYYDIYRATERFDTDGALKAVQDYYETAFTRLGDPAWIKRGLSADKIVNELRQSLDARSPMNLNGMPLVDFLTQMPSDRVQRYYTAQKKYEAIVSILAPSGKRT